MRCHKDFDSSGFSLSAIATATGPFCRAPFLRLVSPEAVIVESTLGLIVVEQADGWVGGAGVRDIVDYRTPLGVGVEGLIGEFADSCPSGTTFSFDSLPREAALVVAAGLGLAGIETEMSSGESTAVLELPRSWDGYMAAIGKKHRHEIRRKRRRYEESIGPVVHETHRGTEWGFEEFVRLHRLAQGEKGAFMSRDVARLFASLSWTDGWRIDLLRIPGTQRASACLFSYVDQDGFYLYNSSYDPDLAEASPGLVLIATCIQQAIEMSLPRFDFLKGDEAYKYRLGAEPRSLFEVTGHK